MQCKTFVVLFPSSTSLSIFNSLDIIRNQNSPNVYIRISFSDMRYKTKKISLWNQIKTITFSDQSASKLIFFGKNHSLINEIRVFIWILSAADFRSKASRAGMSDEFWMKIQTMRWIYNHWALAFNWFLIQLLSLAYQLLLFGPTMQKWTECGI